MSGVGLLFRLVNRRPDDECQRECGTYGSADEGMLIRLVLIWSERRAWFEQGNVERGVNSIPGG